MKAMIALLTLALFGLAGCTTEIPHPSTYSRTTQPKMLAAHHWNLLAADVAQRLATALQQADATGPSPTVLHVARPPSPTVFDVAFHDLLVTQLMQQGFGIAIEPSEDALLVFYDVKYGGTADIDVGTALTEVEVPDNDIIVNVSVVSGNRYVTRISEIFYIDALTAGEYFADLGGAPSRLIEVVGP